MTHLELLDVSAQLDEARRDEDAFGVACRALRQHARADHAAVLVTHGADTRVLASDGAAGESMAAWRQLAQAGAPDAVTSVPGWHAVGRDTLEHGGTLIVGARWPSREASEGRHELLTVFARLAAGRAARVVVRAGESAPQLEQTLVGDSTVMRDVRAQIALAARAPFPVLIRGESGCGKELAARAIHALGQRRHRRCAAINCAALPDDLIESELFGHVRGAFTGAASDRLGLFDEADGGTLFLDEVGELGARAQAKLLRVLQDGEVRRVGENHARRVDVRVIAATNVSLEDAVRRGTFRADLFYRLDVVRVRAFNHTGPGQGDAFVCASFARQAAEIAAGRREPILKVGTLESLRDFLDVDDVLAAYLALLDRRVPAAAYNVASGVGRRVGDLLQTLLSLAGIAPRVEIDPARVRPADASVGDASRLRAATGWQPRVPFELTLRRLLDHWKARLAAA